MPRRDDWDSDWGSWKLRHGLWGVEGKAPGQQDPGLMDALRSSHPQDGQTGTAHRGL